jgi:hypothetical protein
MANLFDRLKRDRKAGASEAPPADAAVAADINGSAAPAPDPAPDTAPNTANDDIRGKDPRRLAEEKADRAGEKWRRAAEARGEISKETGGPKGLEPTRYGDWEKAGRCFDF